MPIPDKPYTRREAYLNAAATGDSSGIPETPYTREEMYLDAIARNGGGGGGGGSSTLAGLTDVDISNPTDGQTLVYNASAGKWENGAGGGGGLVVHYDAVDTGALDKTWQEIYDAYPLVEIVYDEHDEGYDAKFRLIVCTVQFDADATPPDSKYYMFTSDPNSGMSQLYFGCDSASDYPVVLQDGGGNL